VKKKYRPFVRENIILGCGGGKVKEKKLIRLKGGGRGDVELKKG